MSEAIKFFFNGEVRTQSIEEIKAVAIETFIYKLKNLETNDVGIAESVIFPEKFIHINKKNIEFGESFRLSDYIMTDEIDSGLKQIKCADVLFSIVIFRIGSYSYYAIDGKLLKDDMPIQVIR